MLKDGGRDIFPPGPIDAGHVLFMRALPFGPCLQLNRKAQMLMIDVLDLPWDRQSAVRLADLG